MADRQHEMLSLLGDIVEKMTPMLAELNERVEALESAVSTYGETLVQARTDAKIATIFSGMLLAELSAGDRAKFDALMARTANFAEFRMGMIDEPARSMLLASMDTIVTTADDHFAQMRK